MPRLEKYEVEVMFRNQGGEIVALMPYEIATLSGNCLCYAHIGQHGDADYHYVLERSRPARPHEYHSLMRELQGLGYIVTPIRRRKPDQYIKQLEEYKRGYL